MHQPSFLGVVAAPSRKVPELGLGAAAFGALLLIAFALPSHVLAHEAHPPAQPRDMGYMVPDFGPLAEHHRQLRPRHGRR